VVDHRFALGPLGEALRSDVPGSMRAWATGSWNETYFMGGGMEAIYDDVPKAVGSQAFAPADAARGSPFSARRRAIRTGAEPAQRDGNSETELY